MRTGRLAISRGHQKGGPAPTPRLSVVPTAAAPHGPEPRLGAGAPKVATEDYKPVHDRLGALERLARLRDKGVITAKEFAAEKALILGHPVEELVLNQPLLAPEPVRGPSLIGRLLSWKFLPVGLAAGLAFSYASQPQETLRFLNDTLRLFGT